MTRVWMVRAGKMGERELDAIERNRLLYGFLEVGDLSGADGPAIRKRLEDAMPDAPSGRVTNFAGQLQRIVKAVREGDLAVMPRKFTNGLAVGRVTGGYEFDPTGPHRHSRPVEWLNGSVRRDAFPDDLRSRLGCPPANYEIKGAFAAESILETLEAAPDPGLSPGERGVPPSGPEPENAKNARFGAGADGDGNAKRLWTFRPGIQGEWELASIRRNGLLLGFREVGNLSARKNRAAILEDLEKEAPDAEPKFLGNLATQFHRLANLIRSGDLVVMPRKAANGFAIGKVTDGYVFHPKDRHRHSRSVKWVKDPVPRDAFGMDLRRSFESLALVREVACDFALERVREVLETDGDPDPGPEPG